MTKKIHLILIGSDSSGYAFMDVNDSKQPLYRVHWDGEYFLIKEKIASSF